MKLDTFNIDFCSFLPRMIFIGVSDCVCIGEVIFPIGEFSNELNITLLHSVGSLTISNGFPDGESYSASLYSNLILDIRSGVLR